MKTPILSVAAALVIAGCAGNPPPAATPPVDSGPAPKWAQETGKPQVPPPVVSYAAPDPGAAKPLPRAYAGAPPQIPHATADMAITAKENACLGCHTTEAAGEAAGKVAAGEAPPVPVTIWPAPPPESGGICLFEGPLRELAPRLKETPIQVVLTALPRPNQAFWTLSALWSGWLWGRKAVGPFKHVLRRRRYDWNWHAGALYAAFKNLAPHIPLGAPLFMLTAEPEPSFLSAVMLATASAGFDLQGIAIRTRHDPIQLLWQRRAFTLRPTEGFDPSSAGQAMQAYLKERGEPVTYLHLHAAGLSALAENHALAWREEALAQIHAPIQEALASKAYVRHDGSPKSGYHVGSPHSLEVGLWGLHEYAQESDSLPDRVEMAAVQFLQKHPVCTQRELETSLNAEFPGLFTPSLGLIKEILASYATESNGRWHLRPEDSASVRHADLEAAGRALEALAAQLEYRLVRPEGAHRLLLWQEKGKTAYAFTLLASAVVGRILRENLYGSRLRYHYRKLKP
ncbi:MAG TPA: hypothetical protein DC005_08175 [Proteobacteria bacterium]|nr:hypothetical protein [Pseudomonadota bacterium]